MRLLLVIICIYSFMSEHHISGAFLCFPCKGTQHSNHAQLTVAQQSGLLLHCDSDHSRFIIQSRRIFMWTWSEIFDESRNSLAFSLVVLEVTAAQSELTLAVTLLLKYWTLALFSSVHESFINDTPNQSIRLSFIPAFWKFKLIASKPHEFLSASLFSIHSYFFDTDSWCSNES